MTRPLGQSWISALFCVGVLVGSGCVSTDGRNASVPRAGVPRAGVQEGVPEVQWSAVRRRVEGPNRYSDLHLRVNGRDHLIARNVPSHAEAGGSSPLPGRHGLIPDRRAISGWHFEWHISDLVYYAVPEDGHLNVYSAFFGDSDEEAAAPRITRIKRIPY